MSLDTRKLVALIKQAAIDAVNAKDPMSFKVGEVISTSPLKIKINQKISIPASQLILTAAVRDYTVHITNEQAESDIVIHCGLKIGENVVLLRCDGGQKFIVLDRLEASNG